MRLLPHSRRGTWLLAGTVWCAACAVVWEGLPVSPRAVMRLPERSSLLGFGPGGTTAVIQRSFPVNSADESSIELVTVPLMQEIRTLARDWDCHCEGNASSADGNTWVFDRPRKFLVVDLVGDSARMIDVESDLTVESNPVGLTANGKYVLYGNEHVGESRRCVELIERSANGSDSGPHEGWRIYIRSSCGVVQSAYLVHWLGDD